MTAASQMGTAQVGIELATPWCCSVCYYASCLIFWGKCFCALIGNKQQLKLNAPHAA